MMASYLCFEVGLSSASKPIKRLFLKCEADKKIKEYVDSLVPPLTKVREVTASENERTNSSNATQAQSTVLDLEMPVSAIVSFGCKYVHVSVVSIDDNNNQHDQEKQSTSGSALQYLMDVNKRYDRLPDNKPTTTAKNKMFNDILMLLKDKEIGFLACQVTDTGTRITSTMCDVLWFLDPHHGKLQARGLKIPRGLEKFALYNDWHLQHKKKPVVDSSQLKMHLDKLCELLMMPYFHAKESQWLKKTLDDLAEVMHKYHRFLTFQQQRSTDTHLSPAPVRCYKDNWSVKMIPAVTGPSKTNTFKTIAETLCTTDVYKPVCLQDFAPEDRYKRRDWLNNLQLPFPVSLYQYSSGNFYGNVSYAWRLPEDDSERSDEMQMTAIMDVKEKIPVFSTRAMRMDFIHKFAKSTKTKPSLLRAMWAYLQDKSVVTTPENAVEARVDERVSAFLLQADDMDLIYDLRARNGRTKDTRLDPFWDELQKYLEEVSAVHERRHTEHLYMPFAISAADLLEQIKKRLPDESPVPSLSWLKLNFQPSNSYTKAALNYTGRFKVRYTVQQRLLRAQHDDAHYCAHQFTMMKQMATKFDATFICVDDKAVIPLGEPDKPVSTGVRAHNRSLSNMGQDIVALDHDFHVFGIVPSVLFHVDVPRDHRDGFYNGRVHVTLKDKVLQPSSPMRHAAENITILRAVASSDQTQLDNPLLFFYSDGGPDHRTNYGSVQLAHIVMFIVLDLDLLVAARTAPCQSYRNPAERVMSLLNLALQNVALARSRMNETDEIKIRSKSNMKKIRNACSQNENLKQNLSESVQPAKDLLNERFSRLQYKGAGVRIHQAATTESIGIIEDTLKVLDTGEGAGTIPLTLKHPSVIDFMEHHCRKRHYTFQIKKCTQPECLYCSTHPRRSAEPLDFLPDTVLDDNGEYKDFDVVYGTETTDCDRPSLRAKPPTSERDTRFRQVLVSGKARAIVVCAECGKSRVVYSARKLARAEELELERLQDTLYYICGNELFPEGPFHDEILVRESLNCNAVIEPAYYSAVNCNFVQICCHCGDGETLATQDSPVIADLEASYGIVRPICQACLASGKMPVTRNKQKRKA